MRADFGGYNPACRSRKSCIMKLPAQINSQFSIRGEMSTRCIIFLGLAAGILLDMLVRLSVEPLLLAGAAALLLAGMYEYFHRRSRRL